MKEITSVKNPLIKDLLKLQEKSKARKNSGTFLVEGIREATLALQGGYILDSLFIYPEICALESITSLMEVAKNTLKISKEVYQKLAYRDSTEGVVALFKAKEFSLENIQFTTKKPLVLVAEAPEKPGNIGALLRTADAANIDAVFIANPKTDLYNPNIIRASIGCIFTNQIATGSSEEICAFLQKNNFTIFSATLQNSNEYTSENFTNATAIVVGTEATGLTQIWRDTATKNIHIPMQGSIDSMNVSVAAAVLIFEAKRQRK